MANTYTLISSYTVGAGGAASIDFTSIPGTYTDLVIKCSTRSTETAYTVQDTLFVTFNSSGGTAYSSKYILGNGSAASSSGTSSTSSFSYSLPAGLYSYTANTFTNVEIYIPNYAGSTNKSLSGDGVSENNATAGITQMAAGLWANTSAITSIKLACESAKNFPQYSTAYLYGIKNS